MDLRQYFYIIQRWAWLAVIGVIIGAAAGYYTATLQKPVYQSTTKLLFSRPSDDTLNTYMYLTDQQIAQTYMQLLNTQPVVDATSTLLGYPVSARQVTSSMVRDTQIIQVTVRDNDPKHAADIANTMINVLIQQSDRLQSGRYSSSEESLKTQLQQVENQISTLQKEISQISEDSYTAQKTQIESQVKKLEADILDVKQEINILSPPRQTDALGRVVNPKILTQEETNLLQEKQLRLEQLESSLAFYRETYLNLVGGSKTAGSSSDPSAHMDQMNNTLVLYQQIYSNLLASYEEVRLARMRNTPNLVQVEVAVPPTSPILPRPINNAMLGGLIGLALAAGIVLLIEYLDDTIKTADDISRHFGLPVIGYVAEVREKYGEDQPIYVAEEPRSPVAEAFRNLRTNVQYASPDHELHTVMFTSANPSEGKTTMAVNLAVTVAQTGKRVTIIDADMRRPHLHRYFGLSNRVGLSDVFLNHRTIQTVGRPWKDNNQLTVVTSGSLPPNPAELLTSDKMLEFLEVAKAQSDLVILDSPPFLVSDASILAANVDGVVIVVYPGHTHADSVKVMLEQMNRVGARILGVVLNRIPRNRSYYYGGYRHYKGYYYSGQTGYESYYYGEDGGRRKLLRSKHNGSGPKGDVPAATAIEGKGETQERVPPGKN